MGSLSDYYQIYSWPDDPSSEEGSSYQRRTAQNLGFLFSEQSLDYLWQKNTLRILDVCSGVGTAGALFAKQLAVKRIKSSLTFVDVRPNIFEKTPLLFLDNDPFISWESKVLDMNELENIEGAFDIVLMYGHSLAHFNPWQWVEIVKKISRLLVLGGVLLLHETDRKWLDFIENTYQKVGVSAIKEGRPVFSVYKGYDPYTGFITRELYDTESGRSHEINVFPWGISEAGAIIMSVLGHVKIAPFDSHDFWLMGYKIA